MGKIKLICLAYAGGSASVYIPWNKMISSKVDLVPIEYPGRGKRAKEPLCQSIDEIVDAVYQSVISELDVEDDYILYGHSMGSLVAYELAYKLIDNGYKKALHLIFSGGKAPQRRIKKKDDHKLPLELFEDFVLQYGGKYTDQIFANEELKKYFIPILRADIKIVEEYIYQKPPYLLEPNVSILIGEDDESTTWDDIKDWNYVTKGDCQYYYFKGGHFFIQELPDQVMKEINNIVDSIETVKSI
ncbi:thioesterase [Lysinibacillus xylanilyticus]|uniref:thioesterase II family protein n=1 Tax=Lysinibacillus xylanilyticus TaxID=582475 RepID=UPI002B24E895|nr:thioesterase domain-containing protein [Lysinibacillus xylanilyticus]MEB2302398.1 thioesterase [Lysinibacillus xylanilyticus]